MFISNCSLKILVILLLYANDILITSNQGEQIKWMKTELNKEFEMKDLGVAKRILGTEIKIDKKKTLFYLSQELYLKRVFDRFGMSKSKSLITTIIQRI